MNIRTLDTPKYSYITSSEKAKQIISELDNKPILSVDTETTGLDPYTSKISLIQINDEFDNYVFDVRYDTEFSDIHPSLFNPLWEKEQILKILQNALFDMKMLKVHGGVYITNVYDTMLAEQILTLGIHKAKASLEYLMRKYLNLNMPKEPRSTFSQYNIPFKPFQLEYAANDVVPLQLIMDLQKEYLKQEELIHVAELEFSFLKPLCEMELNGICIDKEKWSIIMGDIEKEAFRLEQELGTMLSSTSDQTTLFGASTINVNSQPQLLKALRRYGLEDLESTDVSVLNSYKGLPIIDKILDYRKYKKLCSTYGQTLLDKINPVTDRLHTAFKQLVSTGRLSSSNPNLQNIPNKQLYRTGFVAKDGYTLLTADMSGAELRILANLSKDPMFLEAYKKGLDLHTMTASAAFSIPYDDVNHEQRKKAKPLNFGLCVFEDTNLFTDNGIIKIKDCKIGSNTAHDTGSDEIVDKKFMGEKEVYEIKTQFGYTLNVTEDHLVKVIDKNGNYVDKLLKNVDIDTDYVCIKKDSNLFSNHYFMFDDFSVKEHTNYIDFNLPKKLDEKWARFLGLFISEGYLGKHKAHQDNYGVISFGFSKEIHEFIDSIDGLMCDLFGDRCKKNSEGDYVLYSISSVKLAEWIRQLFDTDFKNKSFDINIPKCIKVSPKSVQRDFLRYLFEGDGCAKVNNNCYDISYSSVSYKLVKDIQLMLLNFGVLSSITEEKREKYPDNIYYLLSIVSEQSRSLFVNDIGFVTNYKNSICISNTDTTVSVYKLPNQEVLLKNLLKNTESKDRGGRWFYDAVYNCLNYTDGIGDRCVAKLCKFDSFLNFINKNGIVSLPIQSIKSKGIKKVYDISVKTHPYFIADGFIVHNCYGLSKFGLAKQLGISDKEAERMIDNFFEQYRGVEEFLENSAKTAIDKGYTKSISGRKRYYELPPFYDPDFKRISKSVQRQGKNMPIQGCLVGDTIVHGVGSIKNKVDKEVLIETGFGKDKALCVYSGVKDVYNLELSNGAVLGITLDHKIPVLRSRSGFIEDVSVLEIKQDDLFLIPEDIHNRIYKTCTMKVLTYRGKEETYDLMCDNIHYFIANGIIVHNSNADTIKKAMIYLVDRLENSGLDAKLVLTVHDEVVVEVRNDHVNDIIPVVRDSIIDGFGYYFKEVPMETDVLVGPCWLKEGCEAKVNGEKCGGTQMKFVEDEKLGTKLVCAECGGDMQ